MLALAPYSDLLILVGRNEAELDKLKQEVWQSKTVIVIGDLADPKFLHRINQIVNAENGINLLVNNAGISEFSFFHQQSIESMRQMVEVNLLTPMQLTQSLLPSLTEYTNAQVVNIGSGFSYIGHPGFVSYCATKFGLRGFTEALGREVAHQGVRLRFFSPRATKTAINSTAVQWMNNEFGVHTDDPTYVAKEFLKFLQRDEVEFKVGAPERFFSKLNQIFPSVITGALHKRFPVIQRALSLKESE